MKSKFKLIVIFMVLVSIFAGINIINTNAATNTDISIVHFDIDPDTTIKKDDNFTFRVWLKNNTSHVITDVFVIIDQGSSFHVPTGMSHVPASPLAGPELDFYCETPLVYKGSGSELRMTIKYTKDGTQSESHQSVFLKTQEYQPPQPSTPTDTSRYMPQLSVDANVKMPILSGGKNNKLILPIQNKSNHTAKNAAVSIDFLENNKYFTFNTVKLSSEIAQISNQRVENVEFSLNVSHNTLKGLYPVKINYTYQNMFNDSYSTSETIYIKVENSNTPPEIRLGNVI